MYRCFFLRCSEKRESPFNDNRYVFEPKIDGYRMIISIQNRDVRLYTCHHNDVTRNYPELLDVAIADDSDAVFDGEVVYQSGDEDLRA